MMKLFSVVLVCLLPLCWAQCETPEYAPFDYDFNGIDWDQGDCACGLQQSPINIDTSKVVRSNAMEISSSAGRGDYFDATVKYGSKALQVEQFDSPTTTGGTLINERYDIAQFHFHSAAEHTIDNVRYPLEVHYVHAGGYGQFAVVGYFFELADESERFVEELASWLRSNAEDLSDGEVGYGSIDLEVGLPYTDGYFYHYRGSLTTPPCTERVDWHLFSRILSVSRQDLDTIIKYQYPNNYRVTMPLNGRVVGVVDLPDDGSPAGLLPENEDLSGAGRSVVLSGVVGIAALGFLGLWF